MRTYHAVALLLGIAAFSQAATAQVVIRERVELDAAGQTTGSTADLGGGTHEVRLIAPADGILSVTTA